jgi:DNA-binding transcriptional regulator YiaG
MTRATVLQEVRQIRFEELYERRQRREVTMAEAGEMLGVTERTFHRWSGRTQESDNQGRPLEGSGQVGTHRLCF